MSTSYRLRCPADETRSAASPGEGCIEFLKLVLQARKEIEALAKTPLWEELTIEHDWRSWGGWDDEEFPVKFVANRPGASIFIEDEYGRRVE